MFLGVNSKSLPTISLAPARVPKHPLIYIVVVVDVVVVDIVDCISKNLDSF